MKLLVATLLAGTATAGAAAAQPVAYDCRGEVEIYNDGRDMAQWYSMRRDWTARLRIDRAARQWSIEESDQSVALSWGAGGPGRGEISAPRHGRPQAQALPLVVERGGVLRLSTGGESAGRFTPATGALRFPDWMNRRGVVATCRAAR